MQKIGFWVFLFFLRLTALMSFSMLYRLSDFGTWMFSRVIKYRRKVVYNNLKQSFPDKSDAEIEQLIKKFYRNLCDITLETLKGFSMSPEELNRRYVITNPEVLNNIFDQNRSVIGVGSHYANWEWSTQTVGYQLKHQAVGVYKMLSNKYIDKYLRESRQKRGTMMIPISETKEAFENTYKKPVLYAFISDQSPSNSQRAHWVKFLNRDTACLHGTEKYSKQYGLPVVYFDVQRVSRGFYTLKLSLLFDHTADLPEGAVTQKYMQTLENIIRQQPENWLWSHRRWKHKRPEVQK